MIKKNWLLIMAIGFMSLISTKSHAAPVSQTGKAVVNAAKELKALFISLKSEAKAILIEAKALAVEVDTILKSDLKAFTQETKTVLEDTKVLLKDTLLYVGRGIDRQLLQIEKAINRLRLAAKELKAQVLWEIRQDLIALIELKEKMIWKLERLKNKLQALPEKLQTIAKRLIIKIDANIAFYKQVVIDVQKELRFAKDDVQGVARAIKDRFVTLAQREKQIKEILDQIYTVL